jgi:hypothetical protein
VGGSGPDTTLLCVLFTRNSWRNTSESLSCSWLVILFRSITALVALTAASFSFPPWWAIPRDLTPIALVLGSAGQQVKQEAGLISFKTSSDCLGVAALLLHSFILPALLSITYHHLKTRPAH